MDAKQRKVVSYSKLTSELKKLVHRKYPNGFMNAMLTIPRTNGTSYKAFTLDTGDTLYLIKVDEEFLRTPEELMNEAGMYRPGSDEEFE